MSSSFEAKHRSTVHAPSYLLIVVYMKAFDSLYSTLYYFLVFEQMWGEVNFFCLLFHECSDYRKQVGDVIHISRIVR